MLGKMPIDGFGLRAAWIPRLLIDQKLLMLHVWCLVVNNTKYSLFSSTYFQVGPKSKGQLVVN